jgi:hypothetical protein
MKLIGVITMLTTVMLASCGSDRFPDYHYKMTIYVGDKAFSSVRGIAEKEVNSVIDSGGRTIETIVTGEAVVIDLSGGRTVYALLSRPENADYSKYVIGNALAPFAPEKKVDERFKDESAPPKPNQWIEDEAERGKRMLAVKGAKNLPRTVPNQDLYRGPREIQTWPMFVTFDNPKDPKSIREVTPDDVGVTRITIEITDEPVASGIEERLEWINTIRGKMLDGRDVVDPNGGLINKVGTGAFSARAEQ